MKRMMMLLGAALAMTGTSAWAQYNSSPVEKMCYGGRNQMGLYLCACDQSFISGMSALVLGNSVVLHGPGELMNCLAWADEMNGVPGGVAGRPAQTPQIPTTIPKADIYKPAISPMVTLPSSAGPCGEVFNACNAARQPDCMNRFNACSTTRIDQDRETAVLAKLLSPDTAAKLAALAPPPMDEHGNGMAKAHSIKLFNSVKTVPSANFESFLETRFLIDPDSFLGKTLNVAPPWSGKVTLDPGGKITLAGDNAGTKPIYVDNVLVFCFNGSKCVSVGQQDASGFKQSNGGNIEHISSMGFNFEAGAIDLTPFFVPGQATSVQAYAIDYGGAAGVSDIFLIVEGGHTSGASQTASQASGVDVEFRLRSKPFNFRFSCDVDAIIGNLMCDRNYTAAYTASTNTWKVCGVNRNLPGSCWEYDNAPASGPYFSAWGIVLKVAADGSMTRDGVAHGQAEIVGTKPLRRPSRSEKLPPLSYKPPKLGMPGNRQGTGGPRYYVDNP
ncbi:hypothetical protein [Falsiruegeria mediterranea]